MNGVGGAGRSAARAERVEDVLDTPVVIAAVLALVAVVLQVAQHDGPWHLAGEVLSWLVWAVFGLDAAVMLAVHPEPRRWAGRHWFELAVLVVAFPLWPRVVPRLTGVEIAPALDLLKAAKLAKVAKAVKVVRYRGSSRGPVVGFVAVAVAVGAFVIVSGAGTPGGH